MRWCIAPVVTIFLILSLGAVLRAYHADQPAWSRPLTAYFRRNGEAWSLVGLER